MTKHLFIFISLFFYLNTSPVWAQDIQPLFGEKSTYQNIKVEKVLSSDLIELEDGKKVRLIGIKAPIPPKRDEEIIRDEYGFVIKKPVDPTTDPSEQSFTFTQNLLLGQKVRLEYDIERKDAEYHTLAYVFLVKDNTFANVEILRQGYAYLQISPPNLKYEDALRAAYIEAKKELRGLNTL